MTALGIGCALTVDEHAPAPGSDLGCLRFGTLLHLNRGGFGAIDRNRAMGVAVDRAQNVQLTTVTTAALHLGLVLKVGVVRAGNRSCIRIRPRIEVLGGRLMTSEFEPAKVERSRANLAEGGVADLVEVREGVALETLAANLPDSIDLVVLDGAKGLYLDVLDLLQPHLRRGALVLADNCRPYVERVRDAANGWVSVAFADDVEMSMWIR